MLLRMLFLVSNSFSLCNVGSRFRPAKYLVPHEYRKLHSESSMQGTLVDLQMFPKVWKTTKYQLGYVVSVSKIFFLTFALTKYSSNEF